MFNASLQISLYHHVALFVLQMQLTGFIALVKKMLLLGGEVPLLARQSLSGDMRDLLGYIALLPH